MALSPHAVIARVHWRERCDAPGRSKRGSCDAPGKLPKQVVTSARSLKAVPAPRLRPMLGLSRSLRQDVAIAKRYDLRRVPLILPRFLRVLDPFPRRQ